MEEARELESSRLEAKLLLELGEQYQRIGDLAGARESFQEALHISERWGERRVELEARVRLGEVLLTLGELDPCEQHLTRSITLARALGSSEHARMALRALSAFFEITGNVAAAFRHFKEFHELSTERQHGETGTLFSARREIEPLERLQRECEPHARSWIGTAVNEEVGQDSVDIDASTATGRRGFRERIAVKKGTSYTLVKVTDINWIKADDNHVSLRTTHGVHQMRSTMREIEMMLDPRRFIRIHRSIIVNVDQVTGIESWGMGEFLFKLVDGSKLTSSRRYRSVIQDAFGC